jgi:hypothetical protein
MQFIRTILNLNDFPFSLIAGLRQRLKVIQSDDFLVPIEQIPVQWRRKIFMEPQFIKG